MIPYPISNDILSCKILPEIEHLKRCDVRMIKHSSLEPIKKWDDCKGNKRWTVEKSNRT